MEGGGVSTAQKKKKGKKEKKKSPPRHFTRQLRHTIGRVATSSSSWSSSSVVARQYHARLTRAKKPNVSYFPSRLIEMVAPMAVCATNTAAALASRNGEGTGVRVRARVSPRTAVRAATPLRVVAQDFPKPANIDKTDNYKQGAELSQKMKVRRVPDARRRQPVASSVRVIASLPRDDVVVAWRLPCGFHFIHSVNKVASPLYIHTHTMLLSSRSTHADENFANAAHVTRSRALTVARRSYARERGRDTLTSGGFFRRSLQLTRQRPCVCTRVCTCCVPLCVH